MFECLDLVHSFSYEGFSIYRINGLCLRVFNRSSQLLLHGRKVKRRQNSTLIITAITISRLLINVPRFALVTVTTFFMAFYMNHVIYLSRGRFDYGYNMQLNVLIGELI